MSMMQIFFYAFFETFLIMQNLKNLASFGAFHFICFRKVSCFNEIKNEMKLTPSRFSENSFDIGNPLSLLN